MKNNYLKKAGAVALAAVMAVTFAPVAALNVFAATAISSDTDISASGTEYKLSGVNTTTVVTASANVTLDLNNCTGADIKVVPGVTLKIVDKSLTAGGDNGAGEVKLTFETGTDNSKPATVVFDAPKAKITSVESNVPNSALSINNISDYDLSAISNLVTSGKLKVAISGGTFKNANPANTGWFSSLVKNNLVGKTATAKDDNDNYYVSNDTINAGVSNAKINVLALNGAVDVKGLKDGHTAKIDAEANAGTTLTAKAEDKKSLVKVTTNYTYNFTSTNLQSGKAVGTSTYKDTMYAAGKDGITALSLAAPTTTDAINVKSLAVGGTITVVAVKNYDRAIDLTESSDNKFDVGMEVPYTDTWTYHSGDDVSDYYGSNGITYFTTDVTKYADETSGVAVIDGNKYVISSVNTKQLENASRSATKTLKVIRGTSESGNAADAYNDIHSPRKVEVSAPTSSSVVIAHVETVGTKYNNTTINNGYVYGANHVEGINKGNKLLGKESATYGNSVVSTELDVPQIAAGTYAVVRDAFADTKVNAGSGITYFYEQKTTQVGTNNADFVLGSVETTTKALKNVLSGDAAGGTNYFNQAKPGEKVYVAKDIKGAFADVQPNVTVEGEISQESAKQSDGLYTWTVNQGTALTGASAIPAYRMYRKTGEHVYTINPAEVSMLVNAGWINEGVAFKVNSVASKTGTPVYRVYNRNNGGMHFYTANAAEKDMLLQNGWTEGAVVFYGAEKATGIPVYRTYNTGSNNGEHNYTTNIAESDMNVKAGWRAEGVAFYVFK